MILNNTINSKIHRSASPDISVIIPFYNVEDYIEECLNSVIAQKGVRTEIILVDDGSTDGSVEIAKDFMRRYKNISLFLLLLFCIVYLLNSKLKILLYLFFLY